MDPLAALFGVGTLVALIFALLSREEEINDAVTLALLLIVVWAASNIGWVVNDPLRVNSAIDGLTLIFFLWLFGVAPKGWRFAFLTVVVGQLLIDIYRELVEPPFTPWAVLLNATFALQLVIVAYPGVKNGWFVLAELCGRDAHPRGKAEG